MKIFETKFDGNNKNFTIKILGGRHRSLIQLYLALSKYKNNTLLQITISNEMLFGLLVYLGRIGLDFQILGSTWDI